MAFRLVRMPATMAVLAAARCRLWQSGWEDAGLELGDRSLHAVMSKIVTPMTDRGPTFPLVQLTLGYGTSPRPHAEQRRSAPHSTGVLQGAMVLGLCLPVISA